MGSNDATMIKTHYVGSYGYALTRPAVTVHEAESGKRPSFSIDVLGDIRPKSSDHAEHWSRSAAHKVCFSECQAYRPCRQVTPMRLAFESLCQSNLTVLLVPAARKALVTVFLKALDTLVLSPMEDQPRTLFAS
nr:hypothetical protein CFP56_24666 [Quercus suber]